MMATEGSKSSTAWRVRNFWSPSIFLRLVGRQLALLLEEEVSILEEERHQLREVAPELSPGVLDDDGFVLQEEFGDDLDKTL